MFRFGKLLPNHLGIVLAMILLSACTSIASPIAPTDQPTTQPNTQPILKPENTPQPTSVPGPNEYITIAQMNLWFHGPGCYGGFEAFNCSGKRSTNLIPLLGTTYDSASKDVIRQQIDWAAQYGVDAFSIEWTTPREVPGSIENILDDNFLKAPNLNKVRWCIFYDLVLRLQQTPGLQIDWSRGMDFDNPDVYNTFIADFEHFAKKYFSQAEYLKIDDRPVVYIWGTWNAIGRYAEAFQEARQKVSALGFDVYIVGDIIRMDHYYPDLAAAYDANTNFVFFVAGSPATSKDVGEAATSLDGILKQWEYNITGLNVSGREEKVILQPGFAPQYDDRLFRGVNGISSPTYIPATSKEDVIKMAMVVRQHAQPAGSQGWKLVWLNTWNNWAETTTFEPTIASGPKYPAGNYQSDMLEVIREVFGLKTFSN
jgi:Glycosyltransferase WbsX